MWMKNTEIRVTGVYHYMIFSEKRNVAKSEKFLSITSLIA